ncbi:chemotaxis protein CheB [Oleiagrimonas soli]|uniref:protein-glutamate methylesterase n=1 Tax=Oleiagrimonas soli TaxID=1543381 RepID=A0A841KFV8_9GAMM|nr:chemotaxis protein CheB [Oleiagrimonas soli]MBB6184072.1 two-component system chemotaxis response regulator CheB/chemosensory pili system protein ChpB (putative protein-glutamate methylesterase) [Oleiagrimonas soli]
MSSTNTTNSGPGVALLFEDADLSAHLRQALMDVGARIVHEGPATKATREDLAGKGAEVVVVNLDATVEEHLDALYDIFDEDRQRIVFNEAEASSGLSGWDQARWARHLAAKLVNALDVDPPRPAEARPVEAHPTEMLLPDEAMPEAPHIESDTPPDADASEATSAAESDALTAELEALLAEDGDLLGQLDAGDAPASPQPSIDLELDEGDVSEADQEAIEAIPDVAVSAVPVEDASESAPEPIAGDVSPHLDEGIAFDTGADDGLEDALRMFDEAMATGEDAPAPDFDPAQLGDVATRPQEDAADDEEDAAPDRERTKDVIVEDRQMQPKGSPYTLLDLDDQGTTHSDTAAPTKVEPPKAPDWDLVDFDLDTFDASPAAAPAAVDKVDPADFGIEKMSASDYLAPDAESEDGAASIEPHFSLELEPIEQAIAPKMMSDSGHEMMLDGHGEGIRRAVVVAAGSSAEARASLRDFVAALHRMPEAVMIGVVHQQSGDDLQALARELGEVSKVLRVRVPENVDRVRHGELLLVPLGKQSALERQGRIQLLDTAEQPLANPSIDLSMTMVAQEMGADAMAVVLAGDAIDALAGAQAINDCGGRVWTLDPADCTDNTMVSVICEEQLAQYTGSSAGLAARLLEVLS